MNTVIFLFVLWAFAKRVMAASPVASSFTQKETTNILAVFFSCRFLSEPIKQRYSYGRRSYYYPYFPGISLLYEASLVDGTCLSLICVDRTSGIRQQTAERPLEAGREKGKLSAWVVDMIRAYPWLHFWRTKTPKKDSTILRAKQVPKIFGFNLMPKYFYLLQEVTW